MTRGHSPTPGDDLSSCHGAHREMRGRNSRPPRSVPSAQWSLPGAQPPSRHGWGFPPPRGPAGARLLGRCPWHSHHARSLVPPEATWSRCPWEGDRAACPPPGYSPKAPESHQSSVGQRTASRRSGHVWESWARRDPHRDPAASPRDERAVELGQEGEPRDGVAVRSHGKGRGLSGME